jgi:carbonic anhydrase/acetyltransferase-like protein (isoleucine patch superfamily)
MGKLYEVNGKRPKIHPKVAYISDNAIIEGDVEIGEGSVIFDNVVLEGHPMKITIGNFTNIQSGTVIHCLTGSPSQIGDYVTIGHNSIIHGCTLGDYVTVGIGSIVMGRTNIKKGGFIGAGSLITEGKEFDERSLILGAPGKKIKTLSEDSIQKAKDIALLYSYESKTLGKKRKLITDI